MWELVSPKVPFETRGFRVPVNAKQLHVLLGSERVLQTAHGSDQTVVQVKNDE